jgi:hypothetical protein
MASSTSPQKTTPFTLSFGLEQEGVLIFQQPLLREVLVHGHTIHKNLAGGSGPKLDASIFPGWAIRAWDGKQHSFVQYTTEPREIAKQLADDAMSVGSASMEESDDEEDDQRNAAETDSTQQRHTSVAMSRIDSGNANDSYDGEDEPKNENEEHFETLSGWVIKRDLSVLKWTEAEKRAAGFDPAAWDTADIEFVSKVYAGEDAIATMQQVVRTLVRALDQEKSKIRATENCGLHVHVGLPDNSRLPIRALQALMFLSMIFEPEIDKFHEPRRIGNDHIESHIRSNLDCWKVTKVSHSRDRMETTDGSGEAVHLRSKYRSIRELRELIFRDDFEDEGAAYKHLKSCLSKGKCHIINWQNIDGENRIEARTSRSQTIPAHTITLPPTVEFRQHAGTFDETEIGHWVRFCVALVKHALHLVENGGEILPDVMSWDAMTEPGDLLGMLDLPDETRTYLERRQSRGEVQDQQYPHWEECDEDGLRQSDGEDEEYGDDCNYDDYDYEE